MKNPVGRGEFQAQIPFLFADMGGAMVIVGVDRVDGTHRILQVAKNRTQTRLLYGNQRRAYCPMMTFAACS